LGLSGILSIGEGHCFIVSNRNRGLDSFHVSEQGATILSVVPLKNPREFDFSREHDVLQTTVVSGERKLYMSRHGSVAEVIKPQPQRASFRILWNHWILWGKAIRLNTQCIRASLQDRTLSVPKWIAAMQISSSA
jgi:hypothetical protein